MKNIITSKGIGSFRYFEALLIATTIIIDSVRCVRCVKLGCEVYFWSITCTLITLSSIRKTAFTMCKFLAGLSKCLSCGNRLILYGVIQKPSPTSLMPSLFGPVNSDSSSSHIHVEQLCKRHLLENGARVHCSCSDSDREHLEIFNAFILIQRLHFADDIRGFSYIK